LLSATYWNLQGILGTALKSKNFKTHLHCSNLYPINVIYWYQSFFIFAGKASLKQ
jgi:hypothetical protein